MRCCDRPNAADAQVLAVLERAVREAAGGRRASARRGPRHGRALAEPRDGARARSDQRLQSAAHRILRSTGVAGRRELACGLAGFSAFVRRLRLRARARARTRIFGARPSDRTRCRISHAVRLRTCCMAGPQAWIYRLHDAAPRLKFTTRVQVADADALRGDGQLLFSPAPDRVLIDDDTPPVRSYGPAPNADAGTAQIVAWRNDRVEIEADSASGGDAGAARHLLPRAGSPRSTAARRRSCVPTFCSAAWRCRRGDIASCSASRRSRP